MSLDEKSPGIYMIRNKKNGRVYIGSTKDISHRFRQWMHEVSIAERDPHSKNVHSDLAREIAKKGWDNYEFTVLDMTDDMFDAHTRSIREIEYIMKYRSLIPKYGYNATMGGESGANKHRSGNVNRKPKQMILYDTKTGGMLLFLKGSKDIPEYIGCRKDALPDAACRGKLIKGRYYAFYSNSERRAELARYIKDLRASVESNGKNADIANNAYKQYKKALKEVDKFAKELGL